jgi:hypothetical protein
MLHARSLSVLSAEYFPTENETSASARTLFDAYGYQQSHALHMAFSELTEHTLSVAPPVHLKSAWSRTALRRLAERHAIVYANRGFRYAVAEDAGRRECRVAKYTKAGISLQFVLDTWNMYSSSALNLHFKGHTRVGAVLRLRSAEVSEVDGKSRLVVNATPIVCGSGFPPDIDHPPPVALRNEDECEDDGPF